MSQNADVARRSEALFLDQRRAIFLRTDRIFAWLMIFQWIAGVVLALVVSPYTWTGQLASPHIHVWAAILLGGAISALPLALVVMRPGEAVTRHVVGVGQMLWSALLIHLTGGRIETHFHVFGSLAFLAFYRDWKVLLSATIVVAADHLLRGLFWPQSVFGIAIASEWRWVEHAAWVIFEDAFLVSSCLQGVKEMRSLADRQAELEHRQAQLERSAAVKTSQTQLAERMRGNPDVVTLADGVVSFLAKQTGAAAGAVFVKSQQDHQTLELAAGYAWSQETENQRRFRLGEGLVGQAAREGRCVVVDTPGDSFRLNGGVGTIQVRSLLIAPLRRDAELEGVLVLASATALGEDERAFVADVTDGIAIQLHAAQARRHTDELLDQTRKQAIELQRQNVAIKQQAALDLKNKELEAASRHKSEFLASMSHELRTPLNAIIGYTSLALSALKGSIPEKQLQNLTNAERSARTLLGLLNDVLDFSRIEAGRMEAFLETVDVGQVVDECAITARGLLAELKKQIKLEIEVPSGLGKVETDFTKLKQIVNNLLSNAVKATDTGSVALRVKPVDRMRSLRIEVEDTGPGIPREKLPVIFESFRQLDGSTRKRFGGTGLGLAITKRLCELLGIEVGVQSTVGKGSVFWLLVPDRCPNRSLPLGDKSSPAPVSGEPATPEPAPRSLANAAGTNGKAALDLSKLVLGHDPHVRATVLYMGGEATHQALEEGLAGLPLTVTRVANATELSARASIEPAWAAILEPGPEGLDALRVLKRDPALRNIPTILCGADGAALPRLVEWLPKPVERGPLVDALLRATRLRRGEVLVVDDDASCRNLYGQILAEAGFTPRLLENGDQALAWLRQHAPPQAIVLDLVMPGMDGFQVLASLQAVQAWQWIPVAVVTGKDLTRAEREILGKGARLLLSKQAVTSDELASRVESLVGAVEGAGARSVLVVDDNPMNLDVAADLLLQASFQVLKAASGPEAIELARNHRPDAIIMDLAMPDMDGFEASAQIRRDPATEDTVIIACSAFSLVEFRNRAALVGCDGFITKPIEPAVFVRQVREVALAAKVRRIAARKLHAEPVGAEA